MSPPARSGGRLLPRSLRHGMESVLGHDLSTVRVHEDASAHALGAVAYTRGDRIHFAPGRYRPDTAAGRKLLGHELTHVAQQREGKVASTARVGGLPLNDSPALEREAERMGESLARGHAQAPPAAVPAPAEAAKGGAGAEAAPVQRVIEDDPALLAYSLANEHAARAMVPRAANQIEDLQADPDTLARHELTRHMNQTVLGRDAGADGLDHALGTAMSACRYGGGMCNEYSALSMAHHMISPEVSGVMPIVRHWAPDMGHSFTSFGDDRDPSRPLTVADPWTMDRDPQMARNTVMYGGRHNVVAEWAGRMPWEGPQLVHEAYTDAMGRFDAAEQDPQVHAGMQQIWNVNQQAQQNVLARIQQGHGRPGWVWDHRTNRRRA